MPPHQSIWRDKGIELEQRFTPNRLRFPRKQRPLSIAEPETLASQALLQQLILGLEEFDDDELAPMDPARDNHQQKCEERHRTHARSLPWALARIMDTTG